MRIRGPRHLVLPDTQVKPGVPTDHLRWAAYYAVDLSEHYEISHVVHVGDHWDMPSLSSYDKRGSKNTVGRDIQKDLDSGDRALEMMQVIWDRHQFDPKKTMLGGNHDEGRISRAINEDPKLEGLLSGWRTNAKTLGWKMVPFQLPKTIDSIAYCHYYDIGPNGQATGRGAGQPSARMQLTRVGGSCIAGHRQGLDVAFRSGNGVQGQACSIIAGSFYRHQEEYRGPTDGQEWRGVVVLNDIRTRGRDKGMFEPMPVSLDYLQRTYGHLKE